MECSLSSDDGGFVKLKTYIQKDKRSEINNQSPYLEKLEKKDKNEPKARKRKQ